MAMAINPHTIAHWLRGRNRMLFGAYLLLALAIMLPMLRPGYILTLDMAFTPELRLPEHLTSSYIFYAALHYLNFIVPSQILQKAMLSLILLLSGIGMHLLVAYLQSIDKRGPTYTTASAYLAGALYMVNPFTYSRFMAGQFAVLLGYALLPFFVRALLRFIARPDWNRAAQLAAWITAVSIVSVHSLGLVAMLTAVSLALAAWRYRRQGSHVKRLFVRGLAVIAAVAVLSGYWLVPLLAGANTTAQAIDGFTAADRQAFATLGTNIADKLGNVLQLQGFWAEGRFLYRLPQYQLPLWGLVVLGLWALVAVGSIGLWRRGQRFAVLLLGFSAVLAVLLAIGGVPSWISSWPLIAGYREPHKFVALLALAYAVFAGYGAAYLLERCKQRGRETLLIFAATALLLLPVTLTPGMWWGFNNQLVPRQYPAGWRDMQDYLNRDRSDSRVLFLPWHLYMSFRFSDRIIVNPADKYFDKPVIASNDLEFNGAAPTFPDEEKRRIGMLLSRASERRSIGKNLETFNIKYVLLAKDNDYEQYSYLDRQTDLVPVAENADLKLYVNRAYKEQR